MFYSVIWMGSFMVDTYLQDVTPKILNTAIRIGIFGKAPEVKNKTETPRMEVKSDLSICNLKYSQLLLNNHLFYQKQNKKPEATEYSRYGLRFSLCA